MNDLLWMLLGMLAYIGAVWVLLLILRANRVTVEEDIEQRRAVSRPAELGPYGREHELNNMRKDGLL